MNFGILGRSWNESHMDAEGGLYLVKNSWPGIKYLSSNPSSSLHACVVLGSYSIFPTLNFLIHWPLDKETANVLSSSKLLILEKIKVNSNEDSKVLIYKIRYVIFFIEPQMFCLMAPGIIVSKWRVYWLPYAKGKIVSSKYLNHERNIAGPLSLNHLIFSSNVTFKTTFQYIS